jgi:subtilisin family serine protease
MRTSKKQLLFSTCIFMSLSSFKLNAMTPLQSEALFQKLRQSQKASLHMKSSRRTIKGTILNENSDESWFNESPKLSNIQGVSSNLAYELFKTPSKNEDIIVAVIDSGIDVNHEDLQGQIWINQNEIPNNGVDDDGNGYIDDLFGWNFIGNSKGMAKFIKEPSLKNGYFARRGDEKYQVDADSLEITRVFKSLLDKENQLSAKEKKLFESLKEQVLAPYTNAKKQLKIFSTILEELNSAISGIESAGIELDDWEILEGGSFDTQEIEDAVAVFLKYFDEGLERDSINDEIKEYRLQLNYHYNFQTDLRSEILPESGSPYYGNNDIIGPNAFHGTHVAGIIAANRDNKIGIRGVARNVKIMAIRAVPNGDERDIDIANAIRYAVDNGAKIINMSFGKSFSPQRELVFQAIKYAESHNVLLIHAAGNESTDNDKYPSFPNKEFEGDKVDNWLEVGASYHLANSRFFPRFSNYGKDSVDLFAPGVRIRSTAPGNSYKTASGTSMAAPVVSGVIATILSFTTLDILTVKETLLKTLNTFPNLEVMHPELGLVPFANLSLHAGIPNIVKTLDALNIERKVVPLLVAPIASSTIQQQAPPKKPSLLKRFFNFFRRKHKA